MAEIPLAELEYLAGSKAIATLFRELEQDAYEQLQRCPLWASQKRKDALIQRIGVIRDVQSKIKLKLALAKQKAKAA